MKQKDTKILKDHFSWVPINIRVPFPPRKPELRKPMLWLDTQKLDGNNELYLINSSGEALDFISVSRGEFTTSDNNVFTVGNDTCEYTNLENGDALKIDEYNEQLDCDFVLQVEIRVKSKQLGHIEIHTPPVKGGINRETVLLWNTNEAGKNVNFEKVE